LDPSQADEKKAEEVFKAFDSNKNGMIEKDELFVGLRKLVTTLEGEFLEKHITSIWQKADRDLSGGIDLAEFKKIYNDVTLSTTNFDALY